MAEPVTAGRRLADLEERSRPRGLFRRYARARLRHVKSRMAVALCGAMALFFLSSPEIGILVAVFAATGEAIDLGVMRHALRHMNEPGRLQALYEITALSAGVQAFSVFCCIAIAWTSTPDGAATALCLASLTAAAVNAGLALPFHNRAALTRLGVYATGLASGLLAEGFLLNGLTARLGYDLVALGVLAFVLFQILHRMNVGERRFISNARDLLRRQRMVEVANQKMAEQHDSLRNMSLVARNAMDSVVISAPDKTIEWVNDAFTRITGFTRDEAIGRTPGDLLNSPHTDLETVRRLDASIASGQSIRTELINRRKDGVDIWVHITLVPLLDNDGSVERLIAIERDISEAKAHEKALADARSAAEISEKAKTEFLATMSHEIRTPMNGIIGMIDLLSESTLNEEQRSHAETIRTSAESLLKIINDILDVSKLDAGKLAIDPDDFALGPCILDAVDLLQGQAATKAVNLEVSFATRLPSIVHGDDGRLRQILVNLVGNAIKFTERGAVTVTARHARVDGKVALSIDVRDTGIGIPPAQLDQIFDRFSQADTTTTRRFGGTGLGLAISRTLARQMGGDITATSKVNKGSCFSLSVTFEDAHHTQIDIGAKRPSANTDILTGLRVLLAEDNQTNRILIEKFLKDAPITLDIATNGAIAADKAAEGHYDLILMDMSMPEMDGLDATRVIRGFSVSQPRIIALTANAFAADKAACFKAGMDAFLSKPVRKAQLLSVMCKQAELHLGLESEVPAVELRANPL